VSGPGLFRAKIVPLDRPVFDKQHGAHFLPASNETGGKHGVSLFLEGCREYRSAFEASNAFAASSPLYPFSGELRVLPAPVSAL